MEFYRDHAIAGGGPVLEAGCGTGRILFPVAAAGIDITGLELAPEMVAQARQHSLRLPEEVQRRVTIVEGDMRALPTAASGPFALICLPYRTFQHLLTTQDQLAALRGFHQRLAASGRLVLNQFDPTADMVRVLSDPEPSDQVSELPVDMEFAEPGSTRTVRVRYRRGYALQAQILQQLFYYEILDGGHVVNVEQGELLLRYTYRYEMEHLLELAGFRVLSLAGDFAGSPYGGCGEQVWVAEVA
ncbi:MAG: class I SAM-dependent methyltransferase [bacterium]|nr:class I SAM-dependent methyltransferase [bacterium]